MLTRNELTQSIPLQTIDEKKEEEEDTNFEIQAILLGSFVHGIIESNAFVESIIM